MLYCQQYLLEYLWLFMLSGSLYVILASEVPDGHPHCGAYHWLALFGFFQILEYGTENFSECPQRLETYLHFIWDHGMYIIMHFVDTVSSNVWFKNRFDILGHCQKARYSLGLLLTFCPMRRKLLMKYGRLLCFRNFSVNLPGLGLGIVPLWLVSSWVEG